MSKTLYVMSDGALKRRHNTLLLEPKGEESRYLPVETVEEIMVMGEVSLNKSLLEFLTQQRIVMHFFNHYGFYAGTYYPREYRNSGPVLLAQAARFMDPEKRQSLAAAFVTGAIANMRRVVGYYQRRWDDLDAEDIIEGLDRFAAEAPNAPDVPALMGVEGNARSCYYQLFDRVIRDPALKMGKRTRRPPANPMNALISFMNTLCYTLALTQIYRTPLDPRISFLHEPSDRRLSLNLDLAEIFKPLLADRLIFSLVNKRVIREEHFIRDGEEGEIHMTDEARKIVLQAWDERLDKTIEHPKTGRRVSWRRLVLLEAQKLQKHVTDGAPYEPFEHAGA